MVLVGHMIGAETKNFQVMKQMMTKLGYKRGNGMSHMWLDSCVLITSSPQLCCCPCGGSGAQDITFGCNLQFVSC